MQRNIGFILWCGWSTGLISIIHFWSLATGAPLFITIIAALTAVIFSYYFTIKPVLSSASKINKTSGLIIIATIAWICGTAVLLARPYGDWDAWTTWNYNAKFMTDPQHWRNVFINPSRDWGNTSHPLNIPSLTALFWRISGGTSQVFPFMTGFIFTLFIPLFIFLFYGERNIVPAIITILLLLLSPFYLNIGFDQYADVPLAFYFLAAIATITLYRKLNDPSLLILCGAFTGICMWTKNEGIILAVLFIIFYGNMIFRRVNLIAFMKGSLPFIITWLAYKIIYANNALAYSSPDLSVANALLNPGNWQVLYSSMIENIYQHFFAGALFFAGYIIYCIYRRVVPSRIIWLIAACLLAYLSIYFVLPEKFEWTVRTSLPRLMLQLYPALLFGMAGHYYTLSGIDGNRFKSFRLRN